MYSIVAFLVTIVTYGIEYFVHASFCLLVYKMLLMNIFYLPDVTFWEMYALVWFLQVLNGKVFDSFFNLLISEDEIKEKINPKDKDETEYFEIDLSDTESDVIEKLDKVREKILEILDKDKENNEEDKEEENGEDEGDLS